MNAKEAREVALRSQVENVERARKLAVENLPKVLQLIEMSAYSGKTGAWYTYLDEVPSNLVYNYLDQLLVLLKRLGYGAVHTSRTPQMLRINW